MKTYNYIYYLIGSTIVLIVINTVFYLLQTSLNKKNYRQTMSTIHIIETADSLLANLKNAETGQRGYLLTNNIDYLKPYYNAEQQIDNAYSSLYSLYQNKPKTQVRLKEIKKSIDLKRAEMARTIKLHNMGEHDEAIRTVNTDIGKEAMEQIEASLLRITLAEKSILLQYQNSFMLLNRRIQVFAIAGSYVFFVIVLASLFTIIQNRKQIVALFRQVDDKNILLQSQKSELQDLTQGLIKQNSELERFAYIASHDLRSPALNIKSLLELYANSVNQQEKAELMDAIKEVSSNFLIKLDDLIKMLRWQKTASTVLEHLYFEEVYMQLIKNLSMEIKKTGARLDHDFSQAPAIQYPKPYLESIIQNLISNAIKYRHPDRAPHILTTSYRISDKTYLRVKDNGRGIDLTKHGAELFGIYKTFHGEKDSRGIGLYITRAQIVAMGGSIKAESAPGEGTTFTIRLN